MTTIVALDLSLTATGWALEDGPAGVLSVKSRGCERLVSLRDAILRLCVDRAEFVVIEGPSYGSKMQAHPVGELHGVVKVALHEAGIPVALVPPANVKKYATGKGNADKYAMLAAAAARLGYTGSQPDEVDALWLLAMGMDAAGRARVTVPALNRSALAAVEWPVLTP